MTDLNPVDAMTNLSPAAQAVPMADRTTLPCCEAWESWAGSASWFVDDKGTYRMPHLEGTHHRFNFCPSCGAERRSAIVVHAELEANAQ